MYFSPEERKFLEENEVCRLATCDKKGIPHVTPVCYIFRGDNFYIFTDYGTKKLKNIKENPNVALIVDVYRQPRNKAVLIIGKAEILERGEEYKQMYDLFYKKFDWVRRDPWNQGEAPLIKVIPEKKISWGLRRFIR
jgi:nitroimidazol reductase NimA-like FMN-containing flavoprotein (pyridoxamine 5'-phosphate oxidase superfamily)